MVFILLQYAHAPPIMTVSPILTPFGTWRLRGFPLLSTVSISELSQLCPTMIACFWAPSWRSLKNQIGCTAPYMIGRMISDIPILSLIKSCHASPVSTISSTLAIKYPAFAIRKVHGSISKFSFFHVFSSWIKNSSFSFTITSFTFTPFSSRFLDTLNPPPRLTVSRCSNSFENFNDNFATFCQTSGFVPDHIWVCNVVIRKSYWSSKFLISDIFSCRIPNEENTPPTLTHGNWPDQDQGFNLIQTVVPGLISPIIRNWCNEHAQILIHLSRRSDKFLGSTCQVSWILCGWIPASIALYTSYSLQASIHTLCLSISWSIVLIGLAFIAYLTWNPKGKSQDCNLLIWWMIAFSAYMKQGESWARSWSTHTYSLPSSGDIQSDSIFIIKTLKNKKTTYHSGRLFLTSLSIIKKSTAEAV